MVTTTRLITVEELEENGGPEGRWELIDGVIVEMPPAGEEHGHAWGEIFGHIWSYLVTRRIGHVFGADAGFLVSRDPDTLRAPDVGFVRAEHLAPDRDRKRFLRVPPDLAVEVISPRDRASEVLAKAIMWLDAGSTLVWLVDPTAETVTVFTRESAPHLFTRDDTLDGGEVLPGFTLKVRDIFAT